MLFRDVWLADLERKHNLLQNDFSLSWRGRTTQTRKSRGAYFQMQYIIDLEKKIFRVTADGTDRQLDMYGKEAFEILSSLWMKASWNQKYSYTFSWFGQPIIQHPEDMIRLQELIYEIAPDVIVETGVAHGGSLIFYAGLLKGMGANGRVIGVDIEIRPHNRKAIEAHDLSEYITLIEGDSVAPNIVDQVKSLIAKDDKVLVILDSCHTKDHVAKELEAYSELVTPGSYILATDGLMQDLHDVPRGELDWKHDNPAAAAREFVANHPEFEIRIPKWRFNESELTENITGWPDAWVYRISQS